MKHIYPVLFLLIFPLLTRSQGLYVDSTRFITGNKPNTAIQYATPTSNKGILFVGLDALIPGGIVPFFPTDTVLENVLVGKIDGNGQISWIKVFGGSDDDIAVSACQTPDGGYAVLAETFSDDGDVTGNHGGNDLWLLRIDSSGNLLWQKCYGSAESDEPISIANTRDNGFILLGATNGSDGDVPFHYGDYFSLDWLVIKTDSVGNVQWSKDLGGLGDEGENGSILAVDNNYYLVSSSASTDHDCTDTVWHTGVNTGGDYYVLKLDDTGRVLWDSSFGGSQQDYINYAFFDTKDSTIVITGNTNSSDYMVTGYQGNGDMWVIKVNKNGTLLWQKDIGTLYEDYGTGICSSYSGGYLTYGWTHNVSGPIGQEDLWLVGLDNLGNETTSKLFGGANVIESSCSVVNYLNGYVATGNSSAFTFTEGSTYGNFDSVGGIFVSYIDTGTLSVNNVNNNHSHLAVYPNPSQEKIRIVVPDNDRGSLSIINNLGQEIYSKLVMQTIYVNVDTDKWPDGMYLIKWQSANGEVLTTKLIKN